MKRFLKLIIISALIFTPNLCYSEDEYYTQELLNNKQENEVTLRYEEDDTLIDGLEQNGEILDVNFYKEEDDDDITDNVEEEFKLFDSLGKTRKKSTNEQTLFNKILKTQIIRTDIPTFLLKDELSFNYKKGPVSEVQYFAGYRGSFGSTFTGSHTTTTYDNLTTEVGIYGKFRNPNYDFKISFLPIPQKKESAQYIDYFWGDLYVMTSKIPHHKIMFGRSRGQVGIEGGSSTYTLPFINRSQIARNFGNLRTTALKIIGNYNYVDYSFAVGSSGRYFTSGMPGAEFTGWVNIKPFGSKDGKWGKLTIGAGFNSGHNQFNYNVGTAYIGYKYKKLWTNFEAAIADGYNGSAGLSRKRAGGFAYTAGWKFTPHLQLIGRIDQFDPDRDVAHDLKREYSVGLNWFIKGQALKFVINYVFCQNQGAKDSHKIILGTQVVI